MSVYWSVRSIPELQGLPPEEQERRYAEAFKAARRRPACWKALGVCGLCAGAGVVIGGLLGAPGIGAGFGGAIGGLSYSLVLLSETRRVLRETSRKLI